MGFCSSQPFLGLLSLFPKTSSGLFWASGPLPSLFWASDLFGLFEGLLVFGFSQPFLPLLSLCLGDFFRPFVGFWAFFQGASGPLPSLFWTRGLFCAFCGLRASSQPFLAFVVLLWASGPPSQPFLASQPFLGLLWASGPLPAFSGLAAFSGPFVGFWASSQPFLALRGFF